MLTWTKTAYGETVCEIGIIVESPSRRWFLYPFGGTPLGPFASEAEARLAAETRGSTQERGDHSQKGLDRDGLAQDRQAAGDERLGHGPILVAGHDDDGDTA